MDGGNVYSRGLRQAVCAEADKRGVKWQYRQSANGATDASFGTIGASGALTFGLSAPVRYIHCACGVAYLPDLAEIRAMADIVLEKAGEQNV
jgi:putative aminopeptidase FrvX